mmetsp:Transcript_116361/g.202334  ORF Transcript_116361/g.202334 Transcript_116361/m.202334 type:complete len:104 (-) Transcript_116361:51-362(-)
MAKLVKERRLLSCHTERAQGSPARMALHVNIHSPHSSGSEGAATELLDAKGQPTIAAASVASKTPLRPKRFKMQENVGNGGRPHLKCRKILSPNANSGQSICV